MFICVFLSTTACQYATYLLYFSGVLFVGPRAYTSVSRVTSLVSTFPSGPMAAKSILVLLFLSTCGYDVCARTYWYTMVADILRPRTPLGGAVSSLLRPGSGAGGVCPPRVPPTLPLPQNGKLDEKMRRIGRIG